MAAETPPDRPDGRLLGLSLRHCIADIIAGTVPLRRVAMIISETACATDADWTNLVYLPGDHTWWVEAPAAARRVVEQLRLAGLIHQPLLEGCDPPEYDPGHHWMAYPL